MTAPELTDRDRLAAEHALRLLEGEELVTARGFMASDPAFADAVAQWEDRLAPLHDTQSDVTPGPEVWAAIEARLSENTPTADVISLQQKVRQWQVASLVSAAAAVALAFVAIPAMQAPTPSAPTETPLMANIPIADTPLRLAVTYVPGREEILVSASGLTADGVHDHELWLVMPEGPARSLGVVVPGEERRISIDASLAEQISDGSQMVLTREPLGGAPEGQDAGPVVAQGEFLKT